MHRCLYPAGIIPDFSGTLFVVPNIVFLIRQYIEHTTAYAFFQETGSCGLLNHNLFAFWDNNELYKDFLPALRCIYFVAHCGCITRPLVPNNNHYEFKSYICSYCGLPSPASFCRKSGRCVLHILPNEIIHKYFV